MRLGDLGVFKSGGTPSRSKKEYWGGEYPWISSTALGATYIDEKSASDWVSEEGLRRSTTKLIKANSVMVGIRVSVGKCAINSVPMCTSQDVVSIEGIDEEQYDLPYLLALINSKRSCFESIKRGTTIQGITTEAIQSIPVPNIGKDEQKRISGTLENVDNMGKLYRKQLSALDALVKSRFIEMFGDPVINLMGWKTASLAELGELNRGVSKHRPRNAPELLNGPYPLIQTGDVANADTYITRYSSSYSEIGLKQSRMWPKGTLCITIAANIAKTGILTFDACFPDSVVGFIAEERTNQLYIHHWFSFFQKILEEQAPQSAQKNINLKILGNLSVMLPPITLQNQFADFVAITDKSRLVLHKLLEKQEMLRAAFMQEHFG